MVWFCCFWVRFDCVGLCVVFASVRLLCGCCGFLCVPVIRCSALLELFAFLFYVVFCLFSFYFSLLFIFIFQHSYFASSLPSSPLLLRRLFLFVSSAPASSFFVFLSSSTARVSSLCPCRHAEGLNMFSIHLKLSCRTTHCTGQFTLLSAPCANSSLFPFGYSWVPFLYWPFLLPCMSCSGSLGLTCCKLVECFLDILVLLSLHMNTFHDVIWSHLGWLDITTRATELQLIVCYFAGSSIASI